MKSILNIYSFILILPLMAFLFIKVKNFRLAWLLAAVIAPIVGIAFLTLFFSAWYAYSIVVLPIILFYTAILAALTGLCVSLWRKQQRVVAIIIALLISLVCFALAFKPFYYYLAPLHFYIFYFFSDFVSYLPHFLRDSGILLFLLIVTLIFWVKK